MASKINDLKKFTILLTKKWVLWIFLTLDFIAFVVVYFLPNVQIPYYVYGMLAIIGFYWASFEVYLDLLNSNRNNPFFSLEAAFRKVKSSMPELISEMKDDLSLEGKEHIREFHIRQKSWVVNITRPCFAYYVEDHVNLESKMQILENYGFIYDTTTGNLKWYRMTEEFVYLLMERT